jgi:hypothetical protein
MPAKSPRFKCPYCGAPYRVEIETDDVFDMELARLICGEPLLATAGAVLPQSASPPA